MSKGKYHQEVIHKAEQLGARVTLTANGHYRIENPDTGEWTHTSSTNPRGRGTWNLIARLRRIGYDVDPQATSELSAEERAEQARSRRSLRALREDAAAKRASHERDVALRERNAVKEEAESRAKYAALWEEVERRRIDGESIDRLMREVPGA